MKTAGCFKAQVLRKRSYAGREWCQRALRKYVKREIEPEGRVRYGYFLPELGKYVRVVTPGDGETIHNAFPDRNFREDKP